MTVLRGNIVYARTPKFVLAEHATFKLWFGPTSFIDTSYATFYPDGRLVVKRGYLWDANFPAMNTENTRPGSCVHDCGYDLIKDGYLPRDPFRTLFDEAMREVLIECNVAGFRAWAWYRAVQIGGNAALDAPRPELMYAPSKPKQVAGWQLGSLFNK